MEHVEASAEAATGGLIAHALEPSTGEETDGAGGPCCLNCGGALGGHYCQNCGQQRHLHRTVASLGHDLVHGILHFEGKIWRTLPMLAWRPGELTRRYIMGERARFVSPLALFLFTAFLMLAVLSSLPGFSAPALGSARGRVQQAQEDVRSQIKLVQTARSRTAEAGGETARYDRTLSNLRRDLVELRQVEQSLSGSGPTLVVAGKKVEGEANGKGWLDSRWRHAKQNPELLLNKLKNSAYKFSWLLIPISLPMIWLLFVGRRDVDLYDHAIFSIYSLSFMSLLVIVASLVASYGPGPLAGMLLVGVPPIHMFRHLKVAYSLSWLSALWRTAALLVITSAALVSWILLLAVISSG